MTGAKKLLISVPVIPDGDVSMHVLTFCTDALSADLGCEVEVRTVGARGTPAGRNQQVRDFLWGSDADWMLCLDSDMAPGVAGLKLLLEHIQRDDVDIASALTLLKSKNGPVPVIKEMTEDRKGSHLHEKILNQPPGLYEVENGLIPGACFIVTREAMMRFYNARCVWFKDVLYDGSVDRYELEGLLNAGDVKAAIRDILQEQETDFHRDRVGIRQWGHDCWFCRNALELGLRVWIDTRILWGHMKTMDLRQFLTMLTEVRRQKAAT